MKPTPLPPNPKQIDRMFLLVLPLLCVSCATKSDPFQTDVLQLCSRAKGRGG